MHRIVLDEDIQPLSEFRSRMAFYFDKIKTSKRPLIITQNGKSSAVLLNVSDYEAMIDKLELLDDIRTAEKQIEDGLGIPHHEVIKKFKSKLNK